MKLLSLCGVEFSYQAGQAPVLDIPEWNVEKGEKIFAVEDIITTGKSVKESIEVVRGLGAEVVGVGCLIDRSGGTGIFDVPLKALASLKVESWDEKDCPFCKQGSPVTKPGSRAKF